MKKFTYGLTLLAAVATLAIGVYSLGGSFDPFALVFFLWAISPYALLYKIIKSTRTRAAGIAALVLVVLNRGKVRA